MEAASDSDDEMGAEENGTWSRKDPGLIGTRIPPFSKPVLSAQDKKILDKQTSAYDYYKLFQPNSFANEIVYQSKLYAVQKDLKKAVEIMDKDTYRLVHKVF